MYRIRGIKRQKGKKYNNRTYIVEGIKFDSKKEGERYLFLKDAEEKGIISGLTRQVKFELIPSVKEQKIVHLKTKDKIKEVVLQLAITYTCDFQYVYNGQVVTEDVKASPKMLPKDYILKRKMMFALKGVRIKEVYKANEPIE